MGGMTPKMRPWLLYVIHGLFTIHPQCNEFTFVRFCLCQLELLEGLFSCAANDHLGHPWTAKSTIF